MAGSGRNSGSSAPSEGGDQMRDTTAETTLRDLRLAGVSVISVEAAGRILGVGKNLSYDLARSGSLPTLRLGRKILVPVARLAQMLGETEQ